MPTLRTQCTQERKICNYLRIPTPMAIDRRVPLPPQPTVRRIPVPIRHRRTLPIRRWPRHRPPPSQRRLRLHRIPRPRKPPIRAAPHLRRLLIILPLGLRPRPEKLVGEIVEADLWESRPPHLVHEPPPRRRELAGLRRRRRRRKPRGAAAEAPRAAVVLGAAASAAAGGGAGVARPPHRRSESGRRH